MKMNESERIIRRPEVCAQTGLKKSTIYNLISQGEFPGPVRLGARARGWRESEVQEWIVNLPRANGKELGEKKEVSLNYVQSSVTQHVPTD